MWGVLLWGGSTTGGGAPEENTLRSQAKVIDSKNKRELSFMSSYSADIASTGQLATQAPQSVHFSASIVKGVPSLIAPTGHSGKQLPQDMHASLILCAIFCSFLLECLVLIKFWCKFQIRKERSICCGSL